MRTILNIERSIFLRQDLLSQEQPISVPKSRKRPREELLCEICKTDTDNLIQLRCDPNHSACEQCIVGMLQSGSDKCPFCRGIMINLSDDQLNELDKIAQQATKLRNDAEVAELMMSMNIVNLFVVFCEKEIIAEVQSEELLRRLEEIVTAVMDRPGVTETETARFLQVYDHYFSIIVDDSDHEPFDLGLLGQEEREFGDDYRINPCRMTSQEIFAYLTKNSFQDMSEQVRVRVRGGIITHIEIFDQVLPFRDFVGIVQRAQADALRRMQTDVGVQRDDETNDHTDMRDGSDNDDESKSEDESNDSAEESEDTDSTQEYPEDDELSLMEEVD